MCETNCQLIVVLRRVGIVTIFVLLTMGSLFLFDVPAFAINPPTALNVTAGASPNINLSWTAPGGQSSYRIYRDLSTITNANKPAAKILSDSSSASYTDSTGIPGERYYYQVTALDVNGNESLVSTSVTNDNAVVAGSEYPHGSFSDSTSYCDNCHMTHLAQSGINIYRRTPSVNTCYVCHDGTGSSYDMESVFTGTAHDTEAISLSCTGCHNPHGTGYVSMTKEEEESLCYLCHGSTTEYGAADIQTEATKTYRHPIGDYSGRHNNTSETASSHNLSNRHAECRDCHHYHKAEAGTHYVGGGPRRASGEPTVVTGSASGGYAATTASDDTYWSGLESSYQLDTKWESWGAVNEVSVADITQIEVILEGKASGTDDYWYIRFYDYSTSSYSSTWYQIGPNGWPSTDAEYTVTITDSATIQKYVSSGGNFKIELACGRASGQGPSDSSDTTLQIDYFGIEFSSASGAISGNWSSKPLKEVWGAEPNNYAAPSTPTAPSETLQDNITYTTTNPITKEYQLCLKCHCSYAYGATPPSGQTDIAKEINPNNYSSHPVYSAGNNSYCNANTLESPWNRRSGEHDTMYCSDCHGSDSSSAPKGPHGSNNNYMLRNIGPGSYSYDNLCLECHKSSVYSSNSSLSEFSKHGANNHVYGAGQNILGCTACHGGPSGYADLSLNSNRSNGGRLGAIHGENFKWKNPDNTETPAKHFLMGGYNIGIRLDDVNAEGNSCWSYGTGGGDPCSLMSGGKTW